MAKKTLGFVEMEWICPRCGSKNPGSQKTCTTCGGPQPADVKFQQREAQPLIKGEEAEKIASARPDVHCTFCGARNKWDAVVCVQCGADLKEAQKRTAGEVVGAFSSAPAPDRLCPSCGQMNPAGALRCSNCGTSMAATAAPVSPPEGAKKLFKLSPALMAVGIIGLIALVVLCIVLAVSGGKTETVSAAVRSTSWTTEVKVEQFQSVSRQNWLTDIPSEAQVGACEYRFAYTSAEPQPVSTEVCGTPYTVDQGTGFGQVVQDCEYEVYAEYCDYTVDEWVEVDRLQLQGSDLFPQLPQAGLANDERLGDSSAVYTIWFDTNQGVLPFETDDLSLFQQARPGSKWTLEIGKSGEVKSAQPEP